jgi:hypothetical protein
MHMGFQRAEVLRALGSVHARHPAGELMSTIPVQTILREALAFLT